MLDFIEAHLDVLNDRLTKLGYNVSTSVSIANTEHDFIKDFIEEGKEETQFNRFTFDVRA